MKKIIPLIIALAAFSLVGCNNPAPSVSDSIITPITVDWNENQQYTNHGTLKNGNKYDFYLLNDTHGSAEYLLSNQEPGINRLSTYIDQKRNENPDGTILVSSGDMFQGSLDSNIGKGELMIDWMKYAKFDAMAIGNHEFDWGIQQLEENISKISSTADGQWGVPVLANNIVNKSTNEKAIGQPYVTFMKNGAKIAIIGSISNGVYDDIDSKIIGGYDFESPTDLVRQQAEGLRNAGADIIAYATHGSVRSVSKTLADYVDLVFCGHSHSDEIETIRHGKYAIPAIQSLCNGKMVGHIQLEYKDNKFSLSSEENSEYITNLALEENEGSKTIYNKYLAKNYTDGPVQDTLTNLKTKKVGKVVSAIESSTLSSSSVCSLFVKVQYDEYKISDEIAGSYYNGARAGWTVGDITYQDIYKPFPFDNETIILEATAEQLNSTWKSIPNYIPVNYETGKTYKIVASSFIVNNMNVTYNRIVKEYENTFQRHVLYNGFLHATDNTLYAL